MENEEILLECPQCHADIAYDDVQVDDDNECAAMCPECGGSSPTDDWFA